MTGPQRSSTAGPGDDADRPPLTPLREMQLVEAWRQGDAEAMGELLRAYQHRVYGVCYRMLRDPEEARDLAHDALIRVMEGLGTYDGRSRLSTWIIRVTMNLCLSHLRKQKIRRHASLDEPIGESGATRARTLRDRGELSGAGRVQYRESQTALREALDALEPQMRAVLVLRDLHDLDYQQIAEALDLPVGTVKSRLFRAREALRAALGERPTDR